MTRPRFAALLPVVFVLLTCSLWFWSRAQYQSLIRSTVTINGSAPEWQKWPEIWTDYTPVPLEIAGALNVPVATFTYPLYKLLHSETSKWTLLALLLAIAVQWNLVGRAWDRRQRVASTPPRRIAAMLGILFAVYLLLASIPMYHVALIYKSAAVIWAVSIGWHFIKAFRSAPSTR